MPFAESDIEAQRILFLFFCVCETRKQNEGKNGVCFATLAGRLSLALIHPEGGGGGGRDGLELATVLVFIRRKKRRRPEGYPQCWIAAVLRTVKERS